ncbi:hypothetical protein LTR44_009899 [Exophiala sp. CCFEE 6388]|nr:hypothetical protein LTR44_009899 [Eurotiomycetes sp. CCFEE 6388]
MAPTMVPDGRAFLPIFDPTTANRPRYNDGGLQSQAPWGVPHPGFMAQSMPCQPPPLSGFMVDNGTWSVPYQLPASTSGLPQFQPRPAPSTGFNGPMIPLGSPLPMPPTPGKPCFLESPPMAQPSLFEPPPPKRPTAETQQVDSVQETAAVEEAAGDEELPAFDWQADVEEPNVIPSGGLSDEDFLRYMFPEIYGDGPDTT